METVAAFDVNVLSSPGVGGCYTIDFANLTFSVISRGCDCKDNIEKRNSTKNIAMDEI